MFSILLFIAFGAIFVVFPILGILQLAGKLYK